MPGGKKIKLGWLFPYSGIFQNIKSDLEQGFECAWHKEGRPQEIEPFAEFIQTGALKDVERAINKLIQFHRCDLLIGVLSTKVAIHIIPLLEKNRTPMILLNLGGDIPLQTVSSDYLLYNSLHLWKSEWAIGYWSQKKFGGEPSLNTALYETGYGMNDCYQKGCAAAGATSIKLNIVKNLSSSPDTSSLIQYIASQRPQHAHAMLSGKEGEQFIQLFHEQDLQSHTQLTVNPFMAEDGILNSIPAELGLFNAMSWSTTLDSPCNRTFVRIYEQAADETPQVFSLLSFEAGLALAAAARALPGRIDRPALAQALGSARIAGPRGTLSISTRPLHTDCPVYLRIPVSSPHTHLPENKILETLPGIEWNDPSFPVGNTYFSGWQNPYLCV